MNCIFPHPLYPICPGNVKSMKSDKARKGNIPWELNDRYMSRRLGDLREQLRISWKTDNFVPNLSDTIYLTQPSKMIWYDIMHKGKNILESICNYFDEISIAEFSMIFQSDLNWGDSMVLRVEISLKTTSILADYRRYFISLIKSAFENTEFHDVVLSQDRVPKPYVFSVKFNGMKSIRDDEVQFNGRMTFYFSTPIFQMLGYMHNYLLKMKENQQKFASHKIESIHMFLEPMKIIRSKTAMLKILSHAVLVRKAKGDNYYVLPKDEDFEESLNHIVEEKLKYFSNNFSIYTSFPRFSYIKVIEKNKLSSTLVKHYGGYVKAFRGKITLESSPRILNFIQEAGLGVRTGQGFGMVRAVKTWEK